MIHVFCQKCTQFVSLSDKSTCPVCGTEAIPGTLPIDLPDSKYEPGSKITSIQLIPIKYGRPEHGSETNTAPLLTLSQLKTRSLLVLLQNVGIGLGGLLLVAIFVTLIEMYLFRNFFGAEMDSNILLRILHFAFVIVAGGALISFGLLSAINLVRIFMIPYTYSGNRKPEPVIKRYYKSALKLSSFGYLELSDYPLCFHHASLPVKYAFGTLPDFGKYWSAVRSDIKTTLRQMNLPSGAETDFSMNPGKIFMNNETRQPDQLEYTFPIKVKISKNKGDPSVNMTIKGILRKNGEVWQIDTSGYLINYQ